MVIRFKNDDVNYQKWVRETGGFVYNNFGGQIIDYEKLHRSDCSFLHICRPGDMKTSVEKICSSDFRELLSWLTLNDMQYSLCKKCAPDANSNLTSAVKPEPTKATNDWDSQKVVVALIEYRKELKPQKSGGTWTKDEAADQFLRQNHFAFLMAASIDRGAKAETVWRIPYLLYQKLGHLDPKKFAAFTGQQIRQLILSLPKKPRYPVQAATTISELAKMVVNDFHGNAEAMWKHKEPNNILRYLQQVKGVGPGIAHMIVRILVDEFDYDPGSNGYRQIDIKPDVHVIRVFYRTGLVDKTNEKLCIQAARRLNPEYPALLDWPAWEIGRSWCDENHPNCKICPLDHVCRHRVI